MRQSPIDIETQNSLKALENIKADISSETKILESIYSKKKGTEDEIKILELQKEAILKFIEDRNIELVAREDRVSQLEKELAVKEEKATASLKDTRDKIKEESKKLAWIIDKVIKEEGSLKEIDSKKAELSKIISDIHEANVKISEINLFLSNLSESKDNAIKEHTDLINSMILDLGKVQKNIKGIEEETILAIQRRDSAIAELTETERQHALKKRDFGVMERRVNQRYQTAFPGLEVPTKSKY